MNPKFVHAIASLSVVENAGHLNNSQKKIFSCFLWIA